MEISRDAVKSVKVYSLDEEKLKYRVLVCIDGNTLHSTPGRGAYQLTLPALTSFGNSNHYNNALIKLDSCVCSAIDAATNDQVWSTTNTGGAAQRVKTPAIEVRMNAPSSQTSQTGQITPAFRGVGDSHQGNFRQLVQLKLVLSGNGGGALAAATNLNNYAWFGDCNGDGVMCGNPFGSQVVIQNRYPASDNLTYICSHALGAGSADAGMYQYQFTITMIPNRD